MRNAIYTPVPFPHRRAPACAPDRWVTTADVEFDWRPNPGSAILDHMSDCVIVLREDNGRVAGILAVSTIDGRASIGLTLAAPFYFAVSVAPNFSRARPAAAMHDCLYSHAREIARVTGLSRRRVLHIADRWFFAQLDASGFLLKRTYFIGVRIFGYWFNTIFSR